MTARIEPLRGQDARTVGWLLAASYGADPAFESLWPDSGVRARVLRALLTASAKDAARCGGAVLAKDGVGAVGVALWLPPGMYPLSTARLALQASALTRAAVAAPFAFSRYATVSARLARDVSPKRTHELDWYLRAMGVHPRARRRGVGALLLAPVLARADEEGARCRLHTSDPANVPYYERFGFRVAPPELPVRRGGPRYLSMIRPPA
jgi:GNAT superfamily N-acetyltransferase